jgi:hypothetical protein
MRMTAIAGLAVALMAGCAAPGQDYLPDPVLCVSAAQCSAMWSRAQVFVTQRSGYRLQIVSDSVIQTFGPMRGDVGLAFTVTQEHATDGSGVIRMRAMCGNMFGCVPTVTSAGRDFYRWVSQTPAASQ